MGDVTSSDFGEMELVQEWTPSGQSFAGAATVKEAHVEKHDDDEQFEHRWKDEADADPIEGDDVLASVGLSHHLKENQPDETVKAGELDVDDIEFVQILKNATAPKLKKLSKPLPSATGTRAIKKGLKKAKTKVMAKKMAKKGLALPHFDKNCVFLKAYAVLAKAKLFAKHYASLSALGELLQGMQKKAKKATPSEQYTYIMKLLHKKYARGLGKYVLGHIQKAMHGKGIVILGAISGKTGMWMHIDGADLGLTDQLFLLANSGVRLSDFIVEMKKLTGKVAMVVAKHDHHKFSKADYDRIFRATCVGKASAFAKCKSKKTQGSCGNTKDCKWIGGWDGKEFFN